MTGPARSSSRHRPTTFKPPPPRRPRRQRQPFGWPAPGWRDRIVPSLVRAFCAVTFAGYGAFEVRFGDAALVVASVGLALFLVAIVYIAAKMGSSFTVGVLSPDVLAVGVLPSALWVASSIEVADPRLGGSARHFLLAALAVVAACCIVLLASALVNLPAPERVQLGALPAVFSLVAILGAGTRFASGSLPDGLSVAWMAAAALTLADGMVLPRSRPMLRFAAILGFALVVVITGIASGARVSNSSNAAIAYLAAIAVCGAMLRLRLVTDRLSGWLIDDVSNSEGPAARGAMPLGRRP